MTTINILKQMCFAAILVAGLAVGVSAQKGGQKKPTPPKEDPPVVTPAPKDPPKEGPKKRNKPSYAVLVWKEQDPTA